jgi:hypothetical protein
LSPIGKPSQEHTRIKKEPLDGKRRWIGRGISQDFGGGRKIGRFRLWGNPVREFGLTFASVEDGRIFQDPMIILAKTGLTNQSQILD